MTFSDPANPLFQMAAQFVNQTGRHIFLTGKAGTGKTTFLKYIRETTFKKTAVVAPTGVAAINAGGVTLHSFFQLPFGPYLPGTKSGWGNESDRGDDLPVNMRLSSEKRELLQELELLIIDEVSMVRADMLDATDAVLRHYRQQPLLPFGGVQVLYIGDLFQLPPVVGESEWDLLKQHYQSPFFFDAQVIRQAPPVLIELEKIYRQHEAQFIRLLNNIRDNIADAADLERLHQHYQPGFRARPEDHYITLTTHNHKANDINQAMLAKLTGKLYEYKGELTGEFNEKALPADMVLQLKEGAQIMFIKNDKGEFRRYYNGKIATVSKIENGSVFIRFPEDPAELELEKETWKNIRYRYNPDIDRIEEETIGSFKQYPVRLAWAITIHKSQGLSFDHAIIDAGEAFSPGQVYVALSRLRSLEGLVLCSRIHPHVIITDRRVLAFSQQQMQQAKLQQELQQQQKVFISRTLLQSFDWEKLIKGFEQFLEQYEDRLIPEKKQAEQWANKLYRLLSEQQEVAVRFRRQLENLMVDASIDGYQPLYLRVSAAVAYFAKSLQEMTAAVDNHVREVSIKQRVKKYLQELQGIAVLLRRKTGQLQQALELSKALSDGEQAPALLELIENHKKNQPFVPLPAEKSSKPVKGETRLISLQLFKEGRSVGEIAKMRGLTAGTVESHLIAFIGTGEIQLRDLVSADKIPLIVKALEENPEGNSSAIKEKLGSSFTYNEIRAVMTWKANSARSPN